MHYFKFSFLPIIIFSLLFFANNQNKNQSNQSSTTQSSTIPISIDEIEGDWESIELDYFVEVSIKPLGKSSIELSTNYVDSTNVRKLYLTDNKDGTLGFIDSSGNLQYSFSYYEENKNQLLINSSGTEPKVPSAMRPLLLKR